MKGGKTPSRAWFCSEWNKDSRPSRAKNKMVKLENIWNLNRNMESLTKVGCRRYPTFKSHAHPINRIVTNVLSRIAILADCRPPRGGLWVAVYCRLSPARSLNRWLPSNCKRFSNSRCLAWFSCAVSFFVWKGMRLSHEYLLRVRIWVLWGSYSYIL